jgi:putative FmdB family regulatory protein
MPIYCYKCTSCGEKIEVLQRSTECTPHDCPECNGQMERVISPVGIIFKGSGFYATDYKKDGKNRIRDEKPAEKKEEKKEESAAGGAEKIEESSGTKEGKKETKKGEKKSGKKETKEVA